MFYKLIENKRNEWFASPGCPARGLVDYIIARGQMRDAQVEAIREAENGKKTANLWDGCIRSTQKPLRLKIRNICGDETIYVL